MGLPEISAKRALIFTGNKGVETALNWYLDHAEDPDINDPVEVMEQLPSLPVTQDIVDSVYEGNLPLGDEYQLILCVREDLRMSIGEIAIQCSHATLGIYVRILNSSPVTLQKWDRHGQKKIVKKIQNLVHLT
eukprot:TRINITY_DN5800_c0_g1_i1.p1 TRINITY_DN5800_c0_g1~~TRINITY_DN5800_c0_g1_i1.p1  ORF type:complete len:133 (-),score=13.27 TRINITY_DN5800_c0_g1_i1:270-668(-)